MTNTAKESCNKDKKTDCLINAQYLGILTNSSKEVTPEAIRDWLILSQQDSLVSPSAWPATKKEPTTQETCGRKQSKLSESSSQNMFFLKTSPACYLQNRVWMQSQADLFHTALPFSGTWMKQGIMLSGKCWALQMSEPRIEGKGCGYWLTPSTIQIKGGKDRVKTRTKYRNSIGRKYAPGSLAEQVSWPTPTKQDSENDGGASQYKRNSVPLNALVKKWAIPREFMHKDSTTDRGKGNLGEQVQGSLNPSWVEFLMQWPIGWSSLKPIKELIWLDWSVDPADTGDIPRVATRIKDRVSRLRAIGNGQVPLCMAKAWEMLYHQAKKEL